MAVSALIGNRAGHVPAAGWELAVMGTASVGLIALLVKGIVRPYAVALIRGGHAPSTSRAHYVTDALFLALGAGMVSLALRDRGAPAFAGLLGWGLTHLGIAAGLIGLRLVQPARRS